MGDGGLGSLFQKAGKWLSDHGVTKEDLDKAKEDAAKAKVEQERINAEQEQAKETAAHEDRAQRAGSSTVTLTGAIEGTAGAGLSVTKETGDGALSITVEAVDPIPLTGGNLTGLTFSIPKYAGAGRYDLGTMDVSGYFYELSFENVDEGFFWAAEYGPGIVTVAAGEGSADIQFVYQDPGDRRIELKGTLDLG
jgi:hypothetical protein